MSSVPEPPAHYSAPGTLLFNRYRTLRELGRGGMGCVLLARDEVLGIDVALKLVPDEVVRDTDGLRDLKREVLRGMKLSHPNIVRVHSFEQDATRGAIVMEFVDGETLAEAKSRQPHGCFEPEALRPWLEQLCSVLDHAHQEVKIAHRDLKPRNLLLTRDGRIKVADFGISCSLAETVLRLTHVDASGTPPYMSPQQAMGEPPSHLDDIYSLGATLYDLLTGKPPFFRGNVVMQAMQNTAPAMAARRHELGKKGAAIPEPWERLVAACLAKEPSARPASGKAILAVLDGAPLPVPATPVESPKEERMVKSDLLARSRASEPAKPAPEPSSVVPLPIAKKRGLFSPALIVSAIAIGALAAGALFELRRQARAPVADTPAAPAAPARLSVPPLNPSRLQPSGALNEPARPVEGNRSRRLPPRLPERAPE